MERFFNMDNKFFSAMSRVADLIILNILCLVCCIPVITIGPSLTALFYVTLKMVRNEESYIVKGFFQSFRQNLKQGIIINVIMLAVAAVLYVDFRFVSSVDAAFSKVMYVLLMVTLLFYLMVFLYIYPLLAKFVNTVKNTFINALLMAIRHLPYTLLIAAVTALPVLAFFFSPSGEMQGLVLLVGIMMGVALIAFINSFFFVRIFDNYIPKEEDGTDTPAEPEEPAGSVGVQTEAGKPAPPVIPSDPGAPAGSEDSGSAGEAGPEAEKNG